MNIEEIRELVRMLEHSNLAEIEIEEEGRRLRLSKAKAAPAAPQAMPIFLGGPGMQGYPQQQYELPRPEEGQGQQEQAPSGPPQEVEEEDKSLVTIDSPMVGTFYVSAAPGEPPFVLPGDRVDPDETVCIVEAMKIMNEVVAKFPAIVEKVLVENGEPVEFGQPLFSVRTLT